MTVSRIAVLKQRKEEEGNLKKDCGENTGL